MGNSKAQLVIEAYPVLVLSDEWLEELYCPHCGSCSWCHITKHDRVQHTVRWAPREVWKQVAHVDPLPPLPGKLTPLHPDHFSPGGLMEQSDASLQRGGQG